MDTTITLRSARFRAEREADWKRLDKLVRVVERSGPHTLSYQDAKDLSSLYRQAANSLSVARETSLDAAMLDYLDALVARAYLAVYAPQERLGGLIHRFLTKGAPQAMRRSALFIGLGFLAMFLGALAGYLLFFEDPAWYNVFLPADLAGGRGPESSTAYLRGVIYDDDAADGGLGAFASFLFSHNTRVAIFVFGLGIFACAPAFLLTFYNGLIFGAFYALHVDRGLGFDLAGWLSIHGVTELSAICIAAGGGLQLGAAVLFPGTTTRADALRRAGRDAVKLAIVAAIMLLAAALLEGFGRQLVQDRTARLVIGWGIGALWLSWFVFGGRQRNVDG